VSEPVKISIPESVAAFVRPGISLQERLRGAGGEVALPPRELVLMLFCLGKDTNAEVSNLATATLASLDQNLLLAALDGAGYHPVVLHALAVTCGADPTIRAVLLDCSELPDVTRSLLQSFPSDDLHSQSAVGVKDSTREDDELNQQTGGDGDDLVAEEGDDDPEAAEAGGGDEEFLSKYRLAQMMGIGEKIKMALTGDKEWRKILIKDANKLVCSGVMKNPRMTEPEVLTVLKSGVQNDEIMRLICANKEWVKNYQIRKALIENPKTPLVNALRYLGTMNEKDVATYAKSRNISSVVATHAKRLLLNKKR
jgi:hypothetical protein